MSNFSALLAELEEMERERARGNLTAYGAQRRLRLLHEAAPTLIAAARRGERLEAALVRCDVWISTLEAPRLPRGDRDVMVTLIRAALEEKP